jgi:ATP-dependent Clp protease ATP-binding subunit ClpX
MSNEEIFCSFCFKSSKDVKKIIAGPTVFICDECINTCYDLLANGAPATTEMVTVDELDADDKIPTPRQIKDHLDKYVIGQDRAKKDIAVAVYNHYKRLQNPIINGVELEKANILMVGPTGSGKTLIAQSISKMLDVPLAIVDSTALTEAGYVGEDVESIITRLMQSAQYDISKAERGIIFIDEIDKKRGKSTGGSSRDVSGEGVQQALLKLLEGTDVMVSPNGKKSELLKVNTRNILFIVGGAFVGLDKIVEQTMDKGSSIGFTSKVKDVDRDKTKDIIDNLEPEHFVKYGMIPEFIGRLPVFTVLEELSEDQLVRVLTEPVNAITKQYEANFMLDDVELEFTTEALLEIAKTAKKRKTGARGLRSVVEKSLTATQFELPELKSRGIDKVIVGANAVGGKEPPTLWSNEDHKDGE